MEGLKPFMVEKKIFERCGAENHLPVGDMSKEVDILTPLAFVFNEASGRLRLGDEAGQQKQATTCEPKQKIPEEKLHTTFIFVLALQASYKK